VIHRGQGSTPLDAQHAAADGLWLMLPAP